MGYIVDSRRCPDCTYRRDEYRHFKNCIPRRYWPPESEWRDFQPVPVKLPAMVGKYPREVYESAFPTVLSRQVVDNQTVYLEPEPEAEPSTLQAEVDLTFERVKAALNKRTWEQGLVDAGVRVSDDAAAIGDREPLPGDDSAERSVRINVQPDIVVAPYGVTCSVCGKVCKHAGALTGHMRSHKGSA